ncbi:helicase-associated domain-containing protein [Micromonospora sp. CPCC 206060]|uniref:helicase-associated domain-containing protein n=1 Tax=Micromonospora sp. CPCC 206060 TaxID=3122406 RepID=UPI002FF0989A
MESLAAYLRTLTQDQLTSLVANRRDATIEPAPKTADQLAVRLLHPSSMVAACALLTLPQLQVGEAAAALGDGCTTARLATLLDVPEGDADLAEALRRLTELALIWPYADGFAAAHLSPIWPNPLDLGPGAAELLVARNMNELRRLAKVYGIHVAGRGKDELIVALVGWLARPENVRRLVAQAPADVQTRLAALAARPAQPFAVRGIMFGSAGVALPWAAERGLVIGSAWGIEEVPREVALALREGHVAAFDPRPPAMPTTPVEPKGAEREAAAAASETLAAITAIVGTMSGGPVPLLKTGGLGVRELRRIAKSSGQDEDRTRLTIELLGAGGLTEASDAGLAPSVAYDDFAAAEPADQLLDIVDHWLTMPACPLAPADSTAVSTRVLYWDEGEEMTLTGLRALTLRTLAEVLPEGHATDPDTLADRLAWQSPVLTDQADEDLQRYVTGIWREAHRLGLLAHGTVTRLCRSLLAGDAEATHRHAQAMLPRSRGTVLLQNDLTAVVTGIPSANLLALLDSAATPESRSGAWTWRFSPASIRRALDAGSTPADLLARVTEVAEGGSVPQTLTYLINDVARRYGRIQVRPAGCCLCSDDETLLTEILNTRSLQALHLVRLTPTVLASAKSQAETLAALRAAGHAPADLRLDGSPAIEIPQRRRNDPSPTEPDGVDMFPLPRLSDPADVARTLLGNR